MCGGLQNWVSAAALCALSAASLADIVVDGEFDDWSAHDNQGIVSLADPSGDATGAFDFIRVSAVSAGTSVFVKLELAETRNGWVNLQSGEERDGTVLMTLQHDDRSIVIDTRSHNVRLDGANAGWAGAGYWSIPTYASNVYEITLDASKIGAREGDIVTLALGGSDALDDALRIELGAQEPIEESRGIEKAAETSFRIANLNTLRDGLTSTDDGRAERLARMLKAVNADVLCFQEEWDSSADDVAAALARGMVAGRARVSWNVFKRGGTQIASIHPVVGFETGESRFALAGVDLPTGKVLIASVHAKCCGHAQSREDRQRVSQMTELTQVVREISEGTFDESARAYQNAPVVVVGDWNLVGSRRPLTVMEDAGYMQIPLVQLGTGGTTATWWDESSSFSPGRLDLAAYAGDSIESVGGFVLNTRVMSNKQLRSAGLQRTDSTGSDHLLLVVDAVLSE